MLKVYGDVKSGNCYKVKLLLNQLERPFEWVALDVVAGDGRTREHLARNPNGKTPLLEIEEGVWLPESNAILNYLAEDSPLLPASGLPRARVLQWQFFEQYSHEPYIATSRFIVTLLGNPPERRADLDEKRPRGYAALDVMESELERRSFFVGEQYTIADISLYAYTHVAEEGGFDLTDYPAIRSWLERVREQPRYIPMG